MADKPFVLKKARPPMEGILPPPGELGTSDPVHNIVGSKLVGIRQGYLEILV